MSLNIEKAISWLVAEQEEQLKEAERKRLFGEQVVNTKPVEANAVLLKGKLFEFENDYDAKVFYNIHVGNTAYTPILLHVIKTEA